ncbi:hypothetical protein EXIGLDRAFT_783695 [Exidia glandulosa HHB12029]|uniref:Uncharacterized protein n=1 Tax=Exidia glandulosa HHB12029 TaxID=1314781 RepID=A0A166MXC5_EXIGL|nr:hypothetical protein EXIGLDRAFT_783695 [Exidia glandulosa HHB12029]
MSYTNRPETFTNAEWFACVAWASAHDDAIAGRGTTPRNVAPPRYREFHAANPRAISKAHGNGYNGLVHSTDERQVINSTRGATAFDANVALGDILLTQRDFIGQFGALVSSAVGHHVRPSPAASHRGQDRRRRQDSERAQPFRGLRGGRDQQRNLPPREPNAQRRARTRQDASVQADEVLQERNELRAELQRMRREHVMSPSPPYEPRAPLQERTNVVAPAPANTPIDVDQVMRDTTPAQEPPPRFPPGLPIPRPTTAPPVLPANDAPQAGAQDREVFAYNIHAVQDAFPPEVRVTPTEFHWTDLFTNNIFSEDFVIAAAANDAESVQEGIENLDLDADDEVLRFLSPEALQNGFEEATTN